jgi:hypothetical protein
MNDNEKELLKQNLALSDMLEQIVDILGFDKIKDLYIRQAKQARQELDKMKQPQRQDPLNDQLRDVAIMANKMGCYDASNFITKQLSYIMKFEKELCNHHS